MGKVVSVSSRSILRRLRALSDSRDAVFLQRFFKTGPGEYGEGDVFLGIRVPAIRLLVREFRGDCSLPEMRKLLRSEYHEARMMALLLMVDKFRHGDEVVRGKVFQAYIADRRFINNWDLVDLSAEHIVGGWLYSRNRQLLYRLAKSSKLWDRRIAVLATFHFIRNNDLKDTLKLADLLMRDEEDLMHKAVGWMLREVGNHDVKTLEAFLNRNAAKMPRTMLRYAIEKFPETKRQAYLRRGRD